LNFFECSHTYAKRKPVPSHFALSTHTKFRLKFLGAGAWVPGFLGSRPWQHLYSGPSALTLFYTNTRLHVHSQRAIAARLVNCIRFRHINCCQLPLAATTSPPLTTSVSSASPAPLRRGNHRPPGTPLPELVTPAYGQL